MDNQQALDFLRSYFNALFVQRDVDALDDYLHPAYFDGDIGDPNVNHIENSKAFLRDWFHQQPTIGVAVSDAHAQGDVISAFLEWSVGGPGGRSVIQKGVAIFVLKDGKIFRRHTYIYFKA